MPFASSACLQASLQASLTADDPVTGSGRPSPIITIPTPGTHLDLADKQQIKTSTFFLQNLPT
jgi:hypothetical protein